MFVEVSPQRLGLILGIGVWAVRLALLYFLARFRLRAGLICGAIETVGAAPSFRFTTLLGSSSRAANSSMFARPVGVGELEHLLANGSTDVLRSGPSMR